MLLLYVRAPPPDAADDETERSVSARPPPPPPVTSVAAFHFDDAASHFKTCPSLGATERSTSETSSNATVVRYP